MHGEIVYISLPSYSGSHALVLCTRLTAREYNALCVLGLPPESTTHFAYQAYHQRVQRALHYIITPSLCRKCVDFHGLEHAQCDFQITQA
jgi:hypothetical protein